MFSSTQSVKFLLFNSNGLDSCIFQTASKNLMFKLRQGVEGSLTEDTVYHEHAWEYQG